MYYMIEAKDAENIPKMDIHSEEIRAIAEELHAKYPNYSSCASYQDIQRIGKEVYLKDKWQYERDYAKATKPLYDDRKAHGLAVLNEIGTPMMGKTKAVLVAECARWMKLNGIKEAYVQNYVFSDNMYWWKSQSWYVFEENGEYFFKMAKKNKTAHKIEGVA